MIQDAGAIRNTLSGAIDSQQDLIDFLEAELVASGWAVKSGSGTDEVKLTTAAHPQHGRKGLVILDGSATALNNDVLDFRIGYENESELTGAGAFAPSLYCANYPDGEQHRRYRCVSSQYQFWIWCEFPRRSAYYRENQYGGTVNPRPKNHMLVCSLLATSEDENDGLPAMACFDAGLTETVGGDQAMHESLRWGNSRGQTLQGNRELNTSRAVVSSLFFGANESRRYEQAYGRASNQCLMHLLGVNGYAGASLGRTLGWLWDTVVLYGLEFPPNQQYTFDQRTWETVFVGNKQSEHFAVLAAIEARPQ